MKAAGSSGSVGRGTSQQRTSLEAGRAQAPLGLTRAGELPRREADELRRELARHRIDRLAHARDVPLSPALGLEPPPPRSARASVAPQALVVAHPVQGRGRHDRVDGLSSSSSSTSWHQTCARPPRRSRGQLDHLA